nr:hypothetical protein [Tanacetum cinerariifolium]
MSTRSNSSHLFSSLRDPESLIRQRNLGEPSSLFDFEEVMNNNQNQEPPPQNGPPPMVQGALFVMGRWGNGHGSGGDGLESGGRGVMGDVGKTGLGMNNMFFKIAGKRQGG